jgi:hypothetical protein
LQNSQLVIAFRGASHAANAIHSYLKTLNQDLPNKPLKYCAISAFLRKRTHAHSLGAVQNEHDR